MLTGIPPRLTIFGAGALAAVVSACLVSPDTLLRRRPSVRLLAAAAIVGALAGRIVLPLLAPAPLRLVSVQFARGRDGLEPVDPIRASSAAEPRPAYVFVAIEAPRGLRETVRLMVDAGGVRETRPLEIRGGRSGGYRLWAPVPADANGRLRATVRTEGGQIVGATSFDVTR